MKYHDSTAPFFSLQLGRVSRPVPRWICFVTNDIVPLYHSQLRLFGSG